MAGRCGCSSSTVTGVSFTDTSTIDVSGVGSPGSPFATAVKRSADAGNLIEAHADGLFVPGSSWVSYSPVWTSVGGSPSLGPGSVLAGRYVLIGKLLFVRIEFSPASGTTFGSGQWGFSLPPGMIGAAFPLPESLLTVFGLDSSGGEVAHGIVRMGGDSVMQPQLPSPSDPSLTFVNATWPWTWAAGDGLVIHGFLEIA